jgi:hypothetical protein
MRLLPENELRQKLQEGYRMQDLTKHFRCSTNTIQVNIEHYQISRNNAKKRKCLLASKNDWTKKMAHVLYHLYWVELLSTTQITKKLGTTHPTILNWLHWFNIPVRKVGTKLKQTSD